MLNSFSPSQTIEDIEQLDILMSFCTLCTLLKGKKMSLQNVFIHILQDRQMNKIVCSALEMNEQEMARLFIALDPSIASSKYITRFINERSKRKT